MNPTGHVIVYAIVLATGVAGGIHARAQSTPPVTVTATGGTSSRALQDKVGDQLSIRDFGAACNGSTDDSMAVSAAVTALNGSNRTLYIPGDCQVSMGPAARMAGATPKLDHQSIVGDAGRDLGDKGTGSPFRGSSFLLTDPDPGGTPFIVNNAVTFRNLTFYWPGVTETTTEEHGNTPPPYPPLIEGASTFNGQVTPGGEVYEFTFDHNEVVNAPTVIDSHLDQAGALHIYNNLIYCTGPCFNIGSMSQESFVYDNDFTPAAYHELSLPNQSYYLWNYAAAKAEVIRATGGSGSPPTAPSDNMNPTWGINQGFNIHNNYVFGMGYFLRAMGGWFDLVDITNNQLDEVPHPLSVENGGAIDGRWDGGLIQNQKSTDLKPDNVTSNSVFYWSEYSAPGASLAIDHVQIGYATGSFLDIENSTNPIYAIVTNPVWQNGSALAGVDAIVWHSPSRLIFQGGELTMASGASSGSAAGKACLNFGNLQSIMVSGVTFIQCGYVITALGTAQQGVLLGNISLATSNGIFTPSSSGPSGITTYPQYLQDILNSWDLPTPGVTLSHRSTDNALVLSAVGTPVESTSTGGTLKTSGAQTPSTTP